LTTTTTELKTTRMTTTITTASLTSSNSEADQFPCSLRRDARHCKVTEQQRVRHRFAVFSGQRLHGHLRGARDGT
jgi:hypothetical protein